jgi:hypothetical protein
MSDDLVARLRHAWDERERQLDEDERVALAAHANVWNAEESRRHDNEFVIVPDFTPSGVGVAFGLKNAAHIARHDPARVLAEVERGRRDIAAKRRILDEYEQAQAYYEQHRAAPAGEVTGLWTAVRALAEAEGLA